MKPGIKLIIAGCLTFLLGGIGFPLFVVLPLVMKQGQDMQFKSPGSVDVTIKEPGRYYLWNDFRTIYEGKSYSRSETIPDGLEVQIHDAQGHQFPLKADTTVSITFGDNVKRSIGYVDLDQPGKLTVQVSGGDERVLSFAESVFMKHLGRVIMSGVAGVISFLIGVALVIWGVVKLATTRPKNQVPDVTGPDIR